MRIPVETRNNPITTDRRIPFGRYESNDSADWPANEFLVGRKRERRRLLNLLFTHGKRSAYLVTGQRGSGKTVFVDYCLREYQQDVFGRFLKGDVGRSIYDRIGLTVVVCLLGILALLLKGLLRFLLHEWQPEPNNGLGWALAIPIILAFLYPVIAARDLLGLASDWRTDGSLVQPDPAASRVVEWLYRWRGTLMLTVLALAGAALHSQREAIMHPLPLLSYLVAATVVFGHLCALRPLGANPGRPLASEAFFSRLAFAALLVFLLIYGHLGGYPGHGDLRAWLVRHHLQAHEYEVVVAAVLCLSASAELGARFLGRSSQLDDWAGRKNRKPWFVRERAILTIKAVSLIVVSAYLLVDPLFEKAGPPSRYGLLHHELPILGLVVILFLSIARMEYNWIIRHLVRTKSGIAFDKRRNDEASADPEGYSQRLMIHTSFTFMYMLWLPVQVVRVNLGVETLDHRRVIEAMIAGLRDAHEQTFLNWRSPLANAGRALRLMVLVTTTTLVGDQFFASSVSPASHCDAAYTYRPKISDILCLPRGAGSSVSRALQFQLFSPKRDTKLWEDAYTGRIDEDGGAQKQGPRYTRRVSIAQIILPTSIIVEGTRGEEHYRHEIDVRLYHVLIFLSLLLIARFVERRWPIFAYRTTLRDIDDTLASLSSKLTQERGLDVKLGSGTLTFGGKRGRQTEPLDPRTVELMFLRLLRQIDDAALRLPFVAGAHFSVPVPDVFFVFDELDKLGTRRGVMPPSPGSDEGPAVANDEERERSLLLKNLFSDLKNILSSAPARFIFVGGRNLHDEWLADQTSRQPLLTRLFVAEIYVPTLLTDRPQDDLSSGVQLYLRAQLRRARALCRTWMTSRMFRWLRHTPRERLSPAFVTEKALAATPLPAISGQDGRPSHPETDRAFEAFLTYRSRGNVKRLKELLEGFIEQIPEGSSESGGPGGELFTHALVLRSTDVHRVQLIADLYRGLLRTFGAGIWKEDKLAPAVFYVADFLLKFHRRAFTWSNLERIDELVHVHRAPELRNVLQAIVDAWTGTLLHPIRNGMYDYRFRIETALELRLASRRSDEEMAALNFTLDEAQEIKDVYRRRLAATSETATFEFEAVLGELHDLDEEYDLARYRYRRAIHLLDEQIAKDLIGTHPAQSIDADKGSVLNRVLARDQTAIRSVRRRAHWPVSRLRLMLQIALTHERTRDFENAALKYRNARALAEVLMEIIPPEKAPTAGTGARSPWANTDSVSQPGNPYEDRHNSPQHDDEYELLKHINLLFQPAFAEAWVGEKAGTLIDASVALVERSIDKARRSLPFVKESRASRRHATGPLDVRHALFALTLAELHDKAGDLLFFKGKSIKRALPGYLDRAHFHYACSLHELRSYNTYRIGSSGQKFGFSANAGSGSNDKPAPTLSDRAAPDFVLQIAAGSLADLGECLLARSSLKETFTQSVAPVKAASRELVLGKAAEGGGTTGAVPRMVDAVLDWLDGSDAADCEFAAAWKELFDGSPDSTLVTWLGKDSNAAADDNSVLIFDAPQKEGARLMVALVLSLAAARALKRDGRLEDAARESLQAAETVARWLLAACFWSRLDKDIRIESAKWQAIMGWIAIYAVKKAQLWWRLSRRSSAARRAVDEHTEDNANVGPFTGGLMPHAVGRLLTVLDMAFSAPTEPADGDVRAVQKEIRRLMASVGCDPDEPQGWLRKSVIEYPYPMTHRLYGLKILIDFATLTTRGAAREDELHIWWSDIEELIRADAEYQGRARFTHCDIGLTLGLASIVAGDFRKGGAINASTIPSFADVARVRSDAIEHLDRAEESFTLRRAYQVGIMDLYYLHDDFNDRRLHYNRAAEMAASGLIGEMLTRLRQDARDDKG